MTIRELDPKSAHQEMEATAGAVYVDVRTPTEFAAGHPAGALNLPVAFAGMGGMSLNDTFVPVASRVLDKNALIIMGCKSGQRSALACELLAQAGFTQLVNVAGGFSGNGLTAGWRQSGLPCSAAPAPGSTWDELRARE